RQRFAGEKSADEAGGIKRKAKPEQARDRVEEIRQRRQPIKDGMNLMRLELPFLHEVHHARHTREREGAVGDHRDRGVKFQPWVGRQTRRMRHIDRHNQGKRLQRENERRRERAHERQAIGGSDQQINQRDRPGEKHENLEEIRERASAERMSTNGKERRLKKKPETDREKIKAPVERDAIA